METFAARNEDDEKVNADDDAMISIDRREYLKSGVLSTAFARIFPTKQKNKNARKRAAQTPDEQQQRAAPPRAMLLLFDRNHYHHLENYFFFFVRSTSTESVVVVRCAA